MLSSHLGESGKQKSHGIMVLILVRGIKKIVFYLQTNLLMTFLRVWGMGRKAGDSRQVRIMSITIFLGMWMHFDVSWFQIFFCKWRIEKAELISAQRKFSLKFWKILIFLHIFHLLGMGQWRSAISSSGQELVMFNGQQSLLAVEGLELLSYSSNNFVLYKIIFI